MRTIVFIIVCVVLTVYFQAHAACDPNIPADLTGDCHVDFNDFAIMASDWLTPSVAHEWVAIYNGPGNAGDGPQAIAVDSNDNIYVTGSSTGSTTYYDYATIKYSPDSNQPVWLARYNGPGDSNDRARAIALDSNDNIYVTGYSYACDTNDDYVTIKYSPDSNQPVWVATYNGPANEDDHAVAIAVDSMDNIYVNGGSYSPATDNDNVTIKYSPDSNLPVWVARYNGPGNSRDSAPFIAVDSADNVYVTGCTYSPATDYDYLTIKYAPDSNQPVWVARYDGPGNGLDWALAIAVDSADNIYVTGVSYSPATDDDYVTIKYAPDSNLPVWVDRYNGSGNGRDHAEAIAVDSNDNVYVTGHSYNAETSSVDYTTIKYSPNSNQPVWVARYDGPVGADYPHAIAVDEQDNVYVTGRSMSGGHIGPCATVKYSPDSNQPVWVTRYDGFPEAIVADSADNIYVTATSNADYATIKYPPDFTCTPPVTGDLDQNCTVDVYDLEIFCRSWLDCNLDPPEDCWQ